ncbi:MAG: hypothetical protein Q8O37_11045 [Sulfuricellaceae bacterium]|nr:hypothetical protein [Sulfuricellaceae bacterium]
MPVSENDGSAPGQGLAVLAESLYLGNLLIFPGIGFILLLWLYFKHRADGPELALCHLKQGISASIWAGILLLVANLAIIALGGYTAVNTWIAVILYFTTCHSTLVLLGVLGLSKAMAGQKYRYPLIGQRCED